jgi:hypothetical protein
MAKQTNKPGGGPNSRVNVEVPQRLGNPARGVSPGGVSQLGEAIGNHITDRRGTSNYRGDPFYAGPAPINSGQRLGNEVAQSTKAGAGGSRDVSKSGSQGRR